MAKPISFIGMSLNDNTLNTKTGKPESAHFEIPVNDISAGNIVATLAAWTTFRTSLFTIITGIEKQEEVLAYRTSASNTRAVSTLTQRENKWLFRYHDNVNNSNYKVSIPTADLSVLPDGSEFIDLTVDPGMSVKADFEALVKSPYDSGHSVTLDSIQFVGRNL